MPKRFFIVGITFFVLCSLSFAQVKEEWIAKYNGHGNNDHSIKIVA